MYPRKSGSKNRSKRDGHLRGQQQHPYHHHPTRRDIQCGDSQNAGQLKSLKLKLIEGLELSITKFEPMKGAGYSKLPTYP